MTAGVPVVGSLSLQSRMDVDAEMRWRSGSNFVTIEVRFTKKNLGTRIETEERIEHAK